MNGDGERQPGTSSGISTFHRFVPVASDVLICTVTDKSLTAAKLLAFSLPFRSECLGLQPVRHTLTASGK